MRRGIHAAAFTLAETLFAMAILSFALLTILGLMPSTLSELNDAEQRVVEARILQTLSAEYQNMKWAQIEAIQKTKYYFDNKGSKVPFGTSAGGSIHDQAHFAVAIYPKDAPPIPGATIPTTKDQRSIRVVITRQLENVNALGLKSIPGVNKIFSILLVNQEPVKTQP